MLSVHIEYRKGIIGLPEKRIISAAVRRLGIEHFSSPEALLDDEDFTIKYIRPDEGDELAYDIIIRVQLHHFPGRPEGMDDISKELANAVGRVLTDTGFASAITIGASVLGCESGWGVAVLHPSTQTTPSGSKEDYRLIEI